MSIKILHKGLADSIQDIGRYGFQHLGIQPNGCMDLLSASLANSILQNDIHTPVIELHFPSSQIQFLEDGIICITGANFVPVLNEKSIALYKPILVKKMMCYLCCNP
jgi:antagonist of KipI